MCVTPDRLIVRLKSSLPQGNQIPRWRHSSELSRRTNCPWRHQDALNQNSCLLIEGIFRSETQTYQKLQFIHYVWYVSVSDFAFLAAIILFLSPPTRQLKKMFPYWHLTFYKNNLFNPTRSQAQPRHYSTLPAPYYQSQETETLLHWGGSKWYNVLA